MAASRPGLRMSYLIGIDIGTGSTKGVLTDHAGVVLASASRRHAMDVPRAGWAEMSPEGVWWSELCAVAGELVDRAAVAPSAVEGIGLSAIGPCMVPVDAAGRSVRPGVLYGVDTRATREIEELESEIGRDEIRRFSGMDLSSQAVGPKIRWFRRNEPDRWRSTTTITTASSYLVHRLTGRHVIDHHQAAHFMPLYDRSRGEWTDEFADLVGPTELLPDLGWSDEIAGHVTAEAARATGLAAGTPVIVGGVDAVQEALSVGVTQPGQMMLMYGSSAFFTLMTDGPCVAPPFWSLPGPLEGTSLLAGGMATTGSATAWFRDVAAPEHAFEELFDTAASVPPGAEGLLFLPYLSGERTPVNDPKARGVIAGLSLRHDRDHVFRALLEGVAHGIRHNLELLAASQEVAEIRAVGGGTTSDVWVQIVSDVTGEGQVVAARAPGASLGDAFLAGVATGHLTLADLPGWVGEQRTISPRAALAPLYDKHHALFKELYRDTAGTVHQLASGGG